MYTLVEDPVTVGLYLQFPFSNLNYQPLFGGINSVLTLQDYAIEVDVWP